MIMVFLVIGCLAFGFLYIFDFNKIVWHKRILNLNFGLGIGILVFSTVGILYNGILTNGYDRFYLPLTVRIAAGFVAAIALCLLIYSLIFALPFTETYVNSKEKNSVVDTGMYALCRHPGVIWFFFFYLFLWLASGVKLMLWAGLIWTFMDVLHVYIQDRWLFPKSLKGYELYRGTTPFLLPTVSSIKRSRATFFAEHLPDR